MEELFNIILNNLRTVGLCLILLVLFRLADILFGIANAKKQSITFDLKKLLWGIFYTICFIIGLASFVTAISSVIPIIDYCNIVVDEDIKTALDGINVIIIACTIVGISVKTYGIEAFKKFKIFIA